MKPKHQEIASRLEKNHQWLIESVVQSWDNQIGIWWEIFNILKEWDSFKLKFVWKDENSIFNIKS